MTSIASQLEDRHDNRTGLMVTAIGWTRTEVGFPPHKSGSSSGLGPQVLNLETRVRFPYLTQGSS